MASIPILIDKDAVIFAMEVYATLKVEQLQLDLIDAKNEIELLKVERFLSADCVLNYGEVKFCHYRQGEGNKCKHCAD